MMISWLQNGIKDSLKTQIKRQMKLIPELARTTQALLKIAKDEQELQEEDSYEQQAAQSYLPYIMNTVSTTLQEARSNSETVPLSTYSSQRHPRYKQNTEYAPSSKLTDSLKSKSKSQYLTSRTPTILRQQYDARLLQ
ncbi:unnamed protein product [Rotaria sp. Silwood2]|nr:unnamed protein product [Rotaria sp. Silwood2]